MSGVKTFFRHCPSCGRRFELRLVSTEEIAEEGESLEAKARTISQSQRKETIQTLDPENPVSLSIPELEEIKELRYNYRCKHCGHVWSERAVQVIHEKVNPEYTGD